MEENISARFQLAPSRLTWESARRRHQHPPTGAATHHRPSALLLRPSPSIASALPGSAPTVPVPLLGYWIRPSARLEKASSTIILPSLLPFFPDLISPCSLPYFVLLASISRSRVRTTMSTTPSISQVVCLAAAAAQAEEGYDPSKDLARKPTRNKGLAWKYAYSPDLHDKLTLRCTLCNKDVTSGILRMEKHLVGGFKEVLKC